MEPKKPARRISLDQANESSTPTLSGRAIRFFSTSKKAWILIAILISSTIGFFVHRHSNSQKRELAAKQAIWPAEAYLREEKYDLALEGAGGDMGLLAIIEQFKGTNVGNLAHFYAAIAYLGKETPDPEAAIKHLKTFQCEPSFMQSRVWGLLGDIYFDREAYEEAKTYYDKAAAHMPSTFTTPEHLLKAAFVSEQMKDYEGAIKYYESIYTRFPKSEKAQEARKHESRVRQVAAIHSKG